MATDLRATIEDVRADGRIRDTRCPGHDDQRASLSVSVGREGRVLLNCHVGCATAAILEAAGLTWPDLHERRNNGHSAHLGEIVATYDYRDETGAPLFQAVRFVPKDFRQRRPDGAGGWVWSIEGVRRVLYRLPELQGQSYVYIPEGEKDVDRLRELELVATCNAMGASKNTDKPKWQAAYTEQLTAAGVQHVAVLPDNDDPGRAHADAIARSCHAAGLQMKVVTLPGLSEGGDVSDWLDAGHTREELVALVKTTACYEPSAQPVAPPVTTHARRAADQVQVRPVFAKPAVTDGFGQCVLQALLQRPYSGWFARGAVHLVAGSSGAGKTSLILDVLPTQARGGAYLGHVGARLDFLVIFADRGTVSNTETLARMRIVPGSLPMAHIPPIANGPLAVAAILTAVEAQDELPAVVFVEGADMLVEDASKTHVVAVFMGALRQIAEHYSLAVILSVGAPKAKPHEQYALKRDQVFGSQAWARLANDVLVMSITGDGSVPTRDLVVLHRNAAAEKFHLEFRDGLLVETEASQATEPNMLEWMQDAETFTQRQFRNAFALSGTRASTILDGFLAAGTLRRKEKGDRTIYLYRRPLPQQKTGQSHSERDKTDRGEERVDPSPENSGTGHETADITSQNIEYFDESVSGSLVSQKSCPLSHSTASDEGKRDVPHFSRGIRAREAADRAGDTLTVSSPAVEVDDDARY